MAHVHTDASQHPDTRGGRLLAAFILTCGMLVLEAVGGWWSGSLALLADAAHMLVDALALMLALWAARLAMRPADARRSYGYGRMEVLAGFTNALLQLVLVAFIVVEALERLFHPEPIMSGVMFWVAVAGLVINVGTLSLLHHHDADDLNMGAASLHVLGDLLGSLAAVVAALLVGQLGWLRADPALSMLVALLLLRSAWILLRRCAHILLEGVPEGLVPGELIAALRTAHPDILDVHHVHAWQLASGSRMATLHVSLVPGGDAQAAMRAVKHILRERYAVRHTTVQIEPEACPDVSADSHDNLP